VPSCTSSWRTVTRTENQWLVTSSASR
jgi:hypothetical protein